MIDEENIRILKNRDLKLIYVLGGPGSGKGTQCAKLVSEFKFNHISTGDCIRDEIRGNTALGVEAKQYSDKGALAPFELITNILVKAILSREGRVLY